MTLLKNKRDTMRLIINYIRSCFCKHDWELLCESNYYDKENSSLSLYTIKTFRCKKCGYAKKYKV